MHVYWIFYSFACDSDIIICFVHVSSFSHVLLLLVQVSLVMLLYYRLYVDVPLPSLSLYHLAAIVNRTSDSIIRIADSSSYTLDC